MPKQVIINMGQAYPFGECEEGDDQTIRVLVRRTIGWQNNRQPLLERAYFFRRLNHCCIIKIEQILEEQQCMHLLYQYVPIRMQTWISNINEKFIQGFCRQLIELGQYLAKCFISINLSLENVGMDQNYRPKYFLDFDFQVDQSLDKQSLKNNYHQQVLALFRPYVQNKIITRPIRQRQDIQIKTEASPSRAVAIKYTKGDNATNSTIRLRQKAVALQKQRKNESINVIGSQWQIMPTEKNRKQSILSSVSNVKISRLGRRIDQIKSKLRGIYSPQPLYLRHQQRSIEKGSNSIAFNWDSTERLYTTSVSTKQDSIQSQAFCHNILRDLQQQESIFQKFEKNLTKQLTKGIPLKKNESLKAKQYEQMKKSDDGYFKDFFQVLEDKPKTLAIQASPRHGNQGHKMRSIGDERTKNNHIETQKAINYQSREDNVKIQKVGYLQLENRVKCAINKSKNLINKFKGDR